MIALELVPLVVGLFQRQLVDLYSGSHYHDRLGVCDDRVVQLVDAYDEGALSE